MKTKDQIAQDTANIKGQLLAQQTALAQFEEQLEQAETVPEKNRLQHRIEATKATIKDIRNAIAIQGIDKELRNE